MARVSLSDVIAAQADLIDRHEQMIAAVLAALSERRSATAAETVSLKRVGTGDKPTSVEVSVVVHEGETLEQAAERARGEYERLCTRFPLPNGEAHAAPLRLPRATPTRQRKAAK